MKKKLLKYAKIAIAMALIASLTLPSFATVGASDGSAFVTKAEFDAALSDFNARLTTFEAGINSKIDSQVSSYLDRNGIWNGMNQILYSTYLLNKDTRRGELKYINSNSKLWDNPSSYIAKWKTAPVDSKQKVIDTEYSNRWEEPYFYFTSTKTGLCYISFAVTGLSERSYWRMYGVQSRGNNWFGHELTSGWTFAEVDASSKIKKIGLYNWFWLEWMQHDCNVISSTTIGTPTNNNGWVGDGMTWIYIGPDRNTQNWFTGQIFVTKDHIYGIEHFTAISVMMPNLYTEASDYVIDPSKADRTSCLALDFQTRTYNTDYTTFNGDLIKEAIYRKDVTCCVY